MIKQLLVIIISLSVATLASGTLSDEIVSGEPIRKMIAQDGNVAVWRYGARYSSNPNTEMAAIYCIEIGKTDKIIAARETSSSPAGFFATIVVGWKNNRWKEVELETVWENNFKPRIKTVYEIFYTKEKLPAPLDKFMDEELKLVESVIRYKHYKEGIIIYIAAETTLDTIEKLYVNICKNYLQKVSPKVNKNSQF